VNLILGKNGEGKTNLLEALNYLSLGRSHRGAKSEELINFTEQNLYVSLQVAGESGTTSVFHLGLNREGTRRIRIDEQPLRKTAELIGRLATVFFDPESILLVQGSPARRRNFVDQGMAEIDPIFLSHLTAFQRAHKQKNRLLRDTKKGILNTKETRRELAAWNKEMSVHIGAVCRGRKRYTDFIFGFSQTRHNTMIDNELKFEFSYLPQMNSAAEYISAGGDKADLKDHFEQEILRELDYIIETEIRRGRPLAGPQMDDFKVTLEGVDLRVFGSQGETRTAAIALILGRSDVLFEKRHVRPILFFDDIFSELDRDRTRRLQEMASRLHQVFVATARLDDVKGWQPPHLKSWTVDNGSFRESDTN